MKILLLTLSIFTFINVSQAAYNQDFSIMSQKEQADYIQNVAKELRRERWVQGYENVESGEFLVEKKWLDEYVANNSNYESPLTKDEIGQIYQCFYGKTCQLYFVGIGGEYYGGSGEEGIFVLLYTKSKKNWKISHVIYAE